MDKVFRASLKAKGLRVPHIQKVFQQPSLPLKDLRLVNLLTQINPVSGSIICQQCRNGRLRFVSSKEFYSNFRKQLRAVSSLLKQSNLISHSQEERDDGVHHFQSSKEMGQKSSGHDKKQPSPDNQKEPDEEEDNDTKAKREFFRSLYTLCVVITCVWLFSTLDNNTPNPKYISWSEFYHSLLLKGEVKNIYIHISSEAGGGDLAVIEVYDDAVIKGQVTPQTRYFIKIPKGFQFEEKIRQFEDEMGMPLKDRIPLRYGYTSSWQMILMQLGLIFAILFIARSFFSVISKRKDGNMTDMMDIFSGGLRQAKFTRVDLASRTGKSISFKDVAGLKEAKIEVIEFMDYLTSPQRFKELGAKTPRGALLLGPPGCGKTLLARALATEAKVPFLAMAGSEFVEMIGGVGAARVRNLFKEARARAPCIIYIDEIDAIGRSRGGSASAGGEDEHTLNQLLVEMDGIGTQEGVIMLAATNRADILDKALLRPGRFDRHIMIDLPTLAEREEIFEVYLNKLKLAQPVSAYARPLSRLTPGMSGADISNICNEAAIHAARDGGKVIDKQDFEYAVERVIAGTQKKTGLLSPTEKKVVAYHESGHALVGWLLKHTDALLRISIVPRTNSALGFAQYLPSDQKLYSQEELFERMCMALGGRAAESLIFNHVSTGAQDDLQRVTKMAYNQIRSFGMNEKIGHLSFPTDEETPGSRPYSQRLASLIDEEARALVSQAFLRTQSVLQENKDTLHKLATTLLDREVLNYDDIEQLIGPPPHGKKQLIEPHGWEGIMPDSSLSGSKPRRKRQKNDSNSN